MRSTGSRIVAFRPVAAIPCLSLQAYVKVDGKIVNKPEVKEWNLEMNSKDIIYDKIRDLNIS